MNICNMSIEGGARAGLISPDEKTIEYLRNREHVPQGEAFDQLAEQWLELATDEGAVYDQQLTINAREVEPQVTWGTNPGMCVQVSGTTPSLQDVEHKEDVQRALEDIGLEAKQAMTTSEIDHVFNGPCKNSQLNDLQKTAAIVKEKKVNESVRAIVLPGSHQVKMDAEKEGLDTMFKQAGFEWRDAGC